MADDDTEHDTTDTPQVIGLRGDAVNQPTGRWLAAVDEDGRLVRKDGMLVRVRD